MTFTAGRHNYIFLHLKPLAPINKSACFLFLPSATASTHTSKETGSLPLGPVQTSASFYAGGRLGFAVHGTNIWTLGDERYPQGRYVFLITRVLEKTAVFASVIKEFLIQRLIDDGTIRDWSTLCFWSDTGTHFRSHRSLASAVCYIPERFKVHTRLCFSLKCHAKSELDGYFCKSTIPLRTPAPSSISLRFPTLYECYARTTHTRSSLDARSQAVRFSSGCLTWRRRTLPKLRYCLLQCQ